MIEKERKCTCLFKDGILDYFIPRSLFCRDGNAIPPSAGNHTPNLIFQRQDDL